MSAGAIDYAAMAQRNPHVLKKIRNNIEDLRNILEPEDSLLDAGCGEGYLYDYLGHKRYTGIDINQAEIAQARKYHRETNFECGDIFLLDGEWDIVFCSRVLMHLPDYEKNVARLCGLAKQFLVVIIPVGQDYCRNEISKIGPVQFRSYPTEMIWATSPSLIIRHDPYSTVVYGSRLS